MTKEEMKEEIRRAGITFRTGLNKDELQEILDKIHVHRNVPPPLPKVGDEPEGDEDDDEKDPLPDPSIDPADPDKKPADEFDELYKKIGSATAPNLPPPIDKPFIEGTRRKKKKGESSPDSMRIEGYLLLLVVDMVFPFSFAFINNMLDKKIKVNAEDLKLSEADTKKLEPLADQAADYMAINISPIAGFLLMATFMYGNNLLAVRMGIGINRAA